ncbi:MAG: RNA pseudouridine synthase [Desulfobacteraceae bacterium]|nr:RNA pseudouridine synthase [Desulfobacteraceae bacterium]
MNVKTISSHQTTQVLLPIIELGRGWLVVDKPQGISVHNDPGKDLISILNRRVAADRQLATSLDCDPEFKVNAVHRLDRETSGVILLACRPEVFAHLSTAFRRRLVRKRYVAVVHGQMPASEKENGFQMWEWELTRSAGGRHNPAGKGKRMACRTRFRVINHSGHYTMIACEPLTGRKHQIRRHAKIAGHAVVGDVRYGSKRSIRHLIRTRGTCNLCLHAQSLEFIPPDRSQPVCTRAETPETMLRLFSDDTTNTGDYDRQP